jgi:telomere length regulation protein
MKTFEQRKYLNAILAFCVKQYFSTEVHSKDDAPISPSNNVSATAGLIHMLTKDNDFLKEHLVSSLSRSSIPMLDDSLSARRSFMAALAKDEGQSCGDPFWHRRLTASREVTHSPRE